MCEPGSVLRSIFIFQFSTNHRKIPRRSLTDKICWLFRFSFHACNKIGILWGAGGLFIVFAEGTFLLFLFLPDSIPEQRIDNLYLDEGQNESVGGRRADASNGEKLGIKIFICTHLLWKLTQFSMQITNTFVASRFPSHIQQQQQQQRQEWTKRLYERLTTRVLMIMVINHSQRNEWIFFLLGSGDSWCWHLVGLER